MREILFRGKQSNDEWIYGNLQVLGECAFISADMGFNKIVDTETVGQYTGLTDKNGVRIFEHDILKFDYVGKNLGVSGIEAVVFENGKFGVLWGWHKDFTCLDGFSNTTIEVIGNIHDNPELLGGEDNG